MKKSVTPVWPAVMKASRGDTVVPIRLLPVTAPSAWKRTTSKIAQPRSDSSSGKKEADARIPAGRGLCIGSVDGDTERILPIHARTGTRRTRLRTRLGIGSRLFVESRDLRFENVLVGEHRRPESGQLVVREFETANESAASGRFEDHLKGEGSDALAEHCEAGLLDFAPECRSGVEMNVGFVENAAWAIFEAANEQ